MKKTDSQYVWPQLGAYTLKENWGLGLGGGTKKRKNIRGEPVYGVKKGSEFSNRKEGKQSKKGGVELRQQRAGREGGVSPIGTQSPKEKGGEV